MKLDLKKYKRPGYFGRSEPSVTIQEKGFSFNVSSYLKYFKDVKFIELFYDSGNSVIGFLKLKNKSEDAFTIKVYRASKSTITLINCTRFIRDNKIIDILKGKRTFPLEEYDENKDMILAKLK